MWFAAKLLFETQIVANQRQSSEPYDPLQEESIRLIQASDKPEAMDKARRAAQSHEHEFNNLHGERLKWRFVELLDLQSLDDNEPGDGTEVYYDFKWKSGRPFFSQEDLEFVSRAWPAPAPAVQTPKRNRANTGRRKKGRSVRRRFRRR